MKLLPAIRKAGVEILSVKSDDTSAESSESLAIFKCKITKKTIQIAMISNNRKKFTTYFQGENKSENEKLEYIYLNEVGIGYVFQGEEDIYFNTYDGRAAFKEKGSEFKFDDLCENINIQINSKYLKEEEKAFLPAMRKAGVLIDGKISLSNQFIRSKVVKIIRAYMVAMGGSESAIRKQLDIIPEDVGKCLSGDKKIYDWLQPLNITEFIRNIENKEYLDKQAGLMPFLFSKCLEY